jgi:SAM-dependent methyltransferase
MGIFDRFRSRPRQPAPSEIRAFFNRAASNEEHYPSTIDPRILHVQLILEHLDLDRLGKLYRRVADVGSGKGRFARLVKERYPESQVVAVDLAEAMLKHVPPGIDRVAASMTELPFADESCGGAYATESLEHAVDIPAAVAELTRIVKPGGRIAIIDKNAKAWGRLKTPAWERWFHREELEGLLARSCRSVRSQPISYWEGEEPDGLFLAWLAEK